MKYIYELVLVDHWSDQIAKWFVESELEEQMMHELINLYNEEVKKESNNGAFLCVTLVEAKEMPSLDRILNCVRTLF